MIPSYEKVTSMSGDDQVETTIFDVLKRSKQLDFLDLAQKVSALTHKPSRDIERMLRSLLKTHKLTENASFMIEAAKKEKVRT